MRVKIAEYIDNLVLQLAKLTFDSQCKFSAWCALGILNDDLVKNQFIAIFGLPNYQMCKAIVAAGFYNYQLINVKQSLELLEELTDDDSIFAGDDIVTQGVNECLTALEMLVIGIDKKDVNYLVNTAENALNWQDMRDNFIENKSMDKNYQNEMTLQKQFLADLKMERITAIDLKKYRHKIKPFYENVGTSDRMD